LREGQKRLMMIRELKCKHNNIHILSFFVIIPERWHKLLRRKERERENRKKEIYAQRFS